MKMSFKEYFESIADFMLSELLEGEKISISFSGEKSYFMRFSKAKVRQNGMVDQGYFSCTFWKKNRTHDFRFGIQMSMEKDKRMAAEALQEARDSIMLLPEDKYQSIPEASQTSSAIYTG